MHLVVAVICGSGHCHGNHDGDGDQTVVVIVAVLSTMMIDNGSGIADYSNDGCQGQARIYKELF